MLQCYLSAMRKKPLILVTNDDGIIAPGIRSLVDVARSFGDVIVVAPDSPQSGQGHAVTLALPIKNNAVSVFGDDIEAYECSGTPVDCVKLAKFLLLHERQIDLCVSGINHGSNASVNILYSGTLSAAMEASLEGINSIGFSLLDYTFDADFTAAKHYARQIIGYVLERGMGGGTLMNVNIPKLPLHEIKGIRVCRQAKGRWVEEFVEGVDPRGEKYYWLTGKFIVEDTGDDHDIWALDHGYVSVVPSRHDLTDMTALRNVRDMEAWADSAQTSNATTLL